MKQTKDRHFGIYGGRYVPEMLIPALDELENTYFEAKEDPAFQKEFGDILGNFVGRKSPLYFAENLTKELGGAKIYLKLESHNHTGAHKINNAVGQALLAKRMGKKKLIAETGAGQHGLATVTVSAKFGFDCKVFMGAVDIRRQYPNVYSMKLMNADVIAVNDGTKTLKDAVNAALKFWIENLKDTHYLLGSALGPYPFPEIVRDFQSVIGKEVREQILEYEDQLPDYLVACVGGGSNSIGLFYPFMNDENIKKIGVEAGGISHEPGQHAARIVNNAPVGIVQGYKSYFLQDDFGQLLDTHSVSAGLDYAGIGPELAYFSDTGKVDFKSVNDQEVLQAFKLLCKTEGIIPALESSHAIAEVVKLAPSLSLEKVIVVNLSGRGDKDIFITAKELDKSSWIKFLDDEIKEMKND